MKLTALLLAALAGVVCGPESRNVSAAPASLGATVVAKLNAARKDAGLEPLAIHPALSGVAEQQAAAVAASGGTASSSGHITRTTRELYRRGYAAHSWTEGTLIATSERGILEQWRQARPQWFEENITGDFEDVGIGTDRYRGRPVVTLVLALRSRTVEWRQAEPLRDLSRVRELALATVNELRGANGREPVVSESRLDQAAQGHAEDMLRRSYYDHSSPEGETAASRVRTAGYRGARTVAENIAKGPFQPDEVVHRWMQSSGHRQNILRRRVTEMGLGVAFGVNDRDEFEIVWVQVFASR